MLTGEAKIGKIIHHRVTEVTEKNAIHMEGIRLSPTLIEGPQPRSDCCCLSSVNSVALW